MIAYNPYCRILYNQNGSVCKKLDLNILKIDWAKAIFKFKKKYLNFSSKFWEIILAEENCYNLGNF